MLTKQIQVKFNLPIELKEVVDKEAKKYGMTLASFFRYILVDRIEQKEKYKTFFASEKLEEIVKEALKNKNKRVIIGDMGEFFAKL